MDMVVFISLLMGLQFAYWIVGKRTFMHQTSYSDYFLAGENVGLLPLSLTFLATQAGGGLVLGAADEAYRFGWPILLYPLGSSLGFVLLGSIVPSRIHRFKISTFAEIFKVYYGSSRLQKIASLLSIISLFMILTAQIVASSKFLESFGLMNSSLFVALWAMVIIYTVQGGLKAVIGTDIIYALFFSLVFLFCFGFIFIDHSLPASLPMQESPKMWGWFFLPLLFTMIGQDMGQRCLAGKTPKIVSRASLIAGFGLMLLCAIPILFGKLAYDLDIDAGPSALMSCVSILTNPWITAFVGCAALTAVVSTAISIVNAIGSNLSNDFTFSFLKRNEMIPIAGGMTCTLSLGAILFAHFFDHIIDLLMLSYELSVSSLFVPMMMALFKKRSNALSAWMALFCGLLSFALFRLLSIDFPSEMGGLLFSLGGFAIGEMLVGYPIRSLIKK